MYIYVEIIKTGSLTTAVFPLAIKYTGSKVEIPCGWGCGPEWVDCANTLLEQILSLSTTSASSSISEPRAILWLTLENGNGARTRHYHWRDIPTRTMRSLAW